MYTSQIVPTQTVNPFEIKTLNSPQYIPLQTLIAPQTIQAPLQPQLTNSMYQTRSLIVNPQPQPLLNSMYQTTSLVQTPQVQMTLPVQQYQPKLIPSIPYQRFIPPTPSPQNQIAQGPKIYQFYKYVPVVQPPTQQGPQFQTTSHSIVPTGSYMIVQ